MNIVGVGTLRDGAKNAPPQGERSISQDGQALRSP